MLEVAGRKCWVVRSHLKDVQDVRRWWEELRGC